MSQKMYDAPSYICSLYFGWPLHCCGALVKSSSSCAIAFIYLWYFQYKYKYDGVIAPDISLVLYPSRCRRGMNSISYRCTATASICKFQMRALFSMYCLWLCSEEYIYINICCAKKLSKRYLANNFTILYGKWWRFICIAQAMLCCMIINQ